jgi:hypothetical protein
MQVITAKFCALKFSVQAVNCPAQDLLLLGTCAAKKFLMDTPHYMVACKIKMRTTDGDDLRRF